MSHTDGSSPAGAAAPSQPTVLVVDDEVILGRSVKRMLSREHDVTVVTSAREALDLLAQGNRYAVILCDLMMPVMTGMDLYDEVLRRWADQAACMVFVTGGAFTERAAAFLEQMPGRRLDKPFDHATLRGAVTRSMGR